jgi:hypothetical protein
MRSRSAIDQQNEHKELKWLKTCQMHYLDSYRTSKIDLLRSCVQQSVESRPYLQTQIDRQGTPQEYRRSGIREQPLCQTPIENGRAEEDSINQRRGASE